jgi:MFS family permease
MTVLALKLLLAPLLVVACSLAGRRWGPRLAGILVVLPVVAGPILLILYVEHGSEFAAEAASAATLAIVPLALFALIFAHLSRRHGWLLTLMIGWVVVLLADLALAQVSPPAVSALLLALIALHGASAVLRRLDQPPSPSIATPWWDLPSESGGDRTPGSTRHWPRSCTGAWPDRCTNSISDRFECGLCLHHSAGRTRWGFGTAARRRAGP